ncbi:MAG TPA: hypothetical protein VK196_16080 [Magnetospirillum sp.]|nr:hypothetical protein [Magnetospirillum sp.]
MKRFESIVAAHPRVGAHLSTETAVVRGQLASLGFAPCDADASGVDWLVNDDTSGPAPAVDVPVLHLNGNISIYGLKQAIVALFDNRG